MSRTALERARDDFRKHLKLTVAVCATAGFVVVMWPTVVTFSESCVVCASRRNGTRVSSLFGLVSWSDDSSVRDSAVVTDGLLGAGHLHAWGNLSRHTRGLFRSSQACEGPSAGLLAHEYAYDPAFRAELRASLDRGEVTTDQVRRAIERELPDDDPGSAAIHELTSRFERLPERIR